MIQETEDVSHCTDALGEMLDNVCDVVCPERLPVIERAYTS
jgi:hypothetical protein